MKGYISHNASTASERCLGVAPIPLPVRTTHMIHATPGAKVHGRGYFLVAGTKNIVWGQTIKDKRDVDPYSQVRTIEGYRTVDIDWNGYGSMPPNEVAIDAARSLVLDFAVLGFSPNRVTLSAEGGIALCFRRQDRYADFEVLNSGETLAVTSDGAAAPEVWEVTNSNRRESLIKLRDYISAAVPR